MKLDRKSIAILILAFALVISLGFVGKIYFDKYILEKQQIAFNSGLENCVNYAMSEVLRSGYVQLTYQNKTMILVEYKQ